MSQELTTAIEAAEKASTLLYEYYAKGESGKITKKGITDRVSDIDVESEELIKKIILDKFSNHSFFGEELPEVTRQSVFKWYVDPLCGSIDFIHGFPEFGLSIALTENDIPVLGVCALPVFHEIYWAEKGGGAFLNGEKISVSNVDKFNDAIVTTHISAKTDDIKPGVELVLKLEGSYIKVPGSFPYAVCNLARGRADAHVELNVSEVHRLAATFIAVEAGGRATRITGAESKVSDNDILITNGLIHDEMLALLNKNV